MSFVSETPKTLQYSFAGKKVLVTGGGRGVGHALVSRLYNDGAIVYTLEKNPELVAQLLQNFPDRSRLTAVVCDLSNWKETQKFIEGFPPLDHLVNSAAIACMGDFLEVKEDFVETALNINLKSLICTSQAVAKGMISAGIRGTIVNISSIAARMIVPPGSIYSITKAGVVSLTKSLAVELGKHGIRANSVSPTAIDTPMITEALQVNPALAELLSGGNSPMARQPLSGKSILEQDDMVNAILFLLSPLSSLMSGADLVIDGGITCC